MMVVGGGGTYYYVHDHLYSPVALVDGVNGDVAERYEYDAYGKATIRNPQYAIRNTSLYGNSYLFTGRRLDILDTNGSLKIQYNRNRYYDPETGRWLTQDPLGYVDGMNLYEYVVSNPFSFLDTYGLAGWTVARNAKWDGQTISKIRGCIATEVIPQMVKNEERADCADVAYAALIRCAEKYCLPLRFRYFHAETRRYKYADAMDPQYNSRADFEEWIRNNLNAITIFENTKQIADYHRVQEGDMFVYDLRWRQSDRFTGHTMVVLGVWPREEWEPEDQPWVYFVAEGHISDEPGEGTLIEEKWYEEQAIRTNFSRGEGDSGPGLRHYRTYEMIQPGAREWNWEQFNRAKRS